MNLVQANGASSGYSTTSNNMTLIHWPLMCGLLQLVQRSPYCLFAV